MRFWRKEAVFLSSCHLASIAPLMAQPLSVSDSLPREESLSPGNHCEEACHCGALPGPGPSLNPGSAPILQVGHLGPDKQQACHTEDLWAQKTGAAVVALPGTAG